MFDKFGFIFSYFEKIIELWKKNKLAFILSIFLVASLGYYNKNVVYNIIGYEEKSKLDKFLEKTTVLERDAQRICQEFNANNVTVFAIHNGIVTNNDFHLMRYSEIASYSNSFIVRKRWMNLPLYPYVQYINICLDKNYFYVYNTKDHADPIFRDVYKQTKYMSIIYLPIYKGRLLIGFTAISFKNKHYFSELEVGQMNRMNVLVEQHLIN